MSCSGGIPVSASHQIRQLLVVLACVAVLAPGCRRKGPVRSSEADSLPKSSQLAFVNIAREMRRLKCLKTFDFAHPDGECVGLVYQAFEHLRGFLNDAGNVSADGCPDLHDVLQQTAII